MAPGPLSAVLVDTAPVNLVDLGILVLLAIALIAGWNSGFFPQLLGLSGAALGGVAIVLALPLAQGVMDKVEPALRALGVLTALLVAVAIGEGLGSGLGLAVKQRIGGGVVGKADKLGGSLIGFGQGILVVWLVGGAIAAGPIPQFAATAQRSVVVRTISGVLPPPTAFVDQLGRWLDATSLPDLFIGLEPFPAAPVDAPSNADANRIAHAAEASTVEVRAAACGQISSGTGFVVRTDGYIVTNAHVVAGSRAVVVGFDGGPPIAAEVVLFDPKLDVALLHVPGLSAPALAFATVSPARGSVGAALGHPGGAALVVIPAAVSNTYEADGRDIYGTGRVTRRIVELRAAIKRGDSGGPLILRDGTVGGIVYAEALTDSSVGYALGPVDVALRVQPAFGATAVVSTGACIR
jgi:S1-C subfamily serine protease